ncbi:2-amino-4-hydroxy-6-hydroxymethyldihydropteridine diphosphokinase [Sphingobacterium sp. lm-10]|uniref:2-amino-4-hydroxy-6- hydroxymethyldihydropteridine diphosphokinase n=1 Tax=Sphingobacterium sp. lm-10 TaxID=2944904 RepID=UPI0020208811|nr:2-amino-4-hydroxy-6-hydroxymethyldihydropteridine diphosphokinase [Sphingobacterium sp. lm-10]MCL7987892.1 2-amino-4-hydroxy-6-hydroxymethyldihydropteridine diphosphokinase [Sphingobacterium sp. lm-10]
MNSTYLLLGANLGNPTQQLQAARIEIEAQIGQMMQASSLYQSDAWGIEDQPTFLNQVLFIQTTLSANELLAACQHIENKLGRVREIKWGARVIDIDILYFNHDIVEEVHLTIPHPYISERNFTLVPLVEIAPNYIHPMLNKTNFELLRQSNDTSLVHQVL